MECVGKVSERWLESSKIRKVFGMFLEGVWNISGNCLEGFWKVSEGVPKISLNPNGFSQSQIIVELDFFCQKYFLHPKNFFGPNFFFDLPVFGQEHILCLKILGHNIFLT